MPGGETGNLSRDILLLLGVKRAKRRFLVLTNKKLFDYFKGTVQEKIADSLGVGKLFRILPDSHHRCITKSAAPAKPMIMSTTRTSSTTISIGV